MWPLDEKTRQALLSAEAALKAAISYYIWDNRLGETACVNVEVQKFKAALCEVREALRRDVAIRIDAATCGDGQ